MIAIMGAIVTAHTALKIVIALQIPTIILQGILGGEK